MGRLIDGDGRGIGRGADGGSEARQWTCLGAAMVHGESGFGWEFAGLGEKNNWRGGLWVVVVELWAERVIEKRHGWKSMAEDLVVIWLKGGRDGQSVMTCGL
jgi:hypothetical protein